MDTDPLQPAAPPRRGAQAAGLRGDARRGGRRCGDMEGRGPRGCLRGGGAPDGHGALARRVAGASAGIGGGRAAAPRDREDRRGASGAGGRRPARAVRCPRPRLHARDRGAGVWAHAGGVWRRRAGGERAASAESPWPRHRHRLRKALDVARPAPERRCRESPRAAPRRRRLLPVLPAGRPRPSRSRPRRGGAAPAGHRLCDALRFRACGAVARAAGIRDHHPVRERHGAGAGVGGRSRGAPASARAGGGPRHGVSRRVRRAGGTEPPGARRRQLSGPCIAGADRPLGRRSRARGRPEHPEISRWTTCRTSSRTWTRRSVRSATWSPRRGFPRRPRSGRARRCRWARMRPPGPPEPS